MLCHYVCVACTVRRHSTALYQLKLLDAVSLIQHDVVASLLLCSTNFTASNTYNPTETVMREFNLSYRYSLFYLSSWLSSCTASVSFVDDMLNYCVVVIDLKLFDINVWTALVVLVLTLENILSLTPVSYDFDCSAITSNVLQLIGCFNPQCRSVQLSALSLS